MLLGQGVALKGAYALKAHFISCPFWQVIEIAANATALRAHHKPTFSVQIAKLSPLFVIVDRTVGQAGTLVR